MVEYAILQVGERLVGEDLKFASDLHAPAAGFRNETFGEVGMDERMDVKDEILLMKMVDQIVEFLFEGIGEEQRGLHFAFAEA